ncbi:gliding motility-associated protein GldM [Pustulibacterium marinum]|uniref:Gliding motility-associated protein GldM n=1 Tax=Pustulibacterium marinum TaxID=1224947 RepID=A0A1I7GRY0_9FLAO|nr:gliding motility protein GldM [Pustulibacterium marinum]SFU51195.1 gliding motility-associated protein GldM [Pustulibacterium marinum]
MAGGKLSPRQRMINLMYLVFIAMLALNMSKEVLSAFGLMNEKFENSNESQVAKNSAALTEIKTKASEDAGHFADSYKKSQEVSALSASFFAYLGELKADIKGHFEAEEETGKLPYEEMDKSTIDEEWFGGAGLTEKGKEIMAEFQKYRDGMEAIIGGDDRLKPVMSEIEEKFSTEPVKDKDGNNVPYLAYNFQGFPAIASTAKLSAFQNDVKTIEAEIYSAYLGGALSDMAAINENNYQAIVLPKKSAFFAGEQFEGKVVLGRYDDSTVPTAVEVNGSKLNMDEAVENGQVNLKFNTGNIGEHKINGKFTFKQDGKDVEIPIEGNYVVVPKPNSATISADKMNVVYRGVKNPMTISFAGVDANKINASAPGLSKTGTSSYMMTPGSGKEVTIKVNGTLSDGSAVSDKKTFRIKDLPKPTGSFLSMTNDMMKLPKANIQVGDVGAKFEDFDFDLPLKVSSFKVSVPGQASITVNGTKMNSQAKSAIAKARRGDIIQIFDIKASAVGSSVKIKNVSSFAIEVAN